MDLYIYIWIYISQDRVDRIGLENKTARIELLGKDCQYRDAWIGLLGQDCKDRTAWQGCSDSTDKTRHDMQHGHGHAAWTNSMEMQH